MKVLVIHNTYQQPGGEDVVVAQEIGLLQQHGHKVGTYTRSNHEIDSLPLIEKIKLPGRIISANDSKLAVRRLLRQFKPDVVHVHNTFAMISPSIYEACQEENAPVVQTLHNYRLLCPAATLFRDGKPCEDCLTHSLLHSVGHACYRGSRAMSGAIALMLKTHRARQTWNHRIDAYIALSHFVKSKYVQSGIPSSRVYVKPNFVDPDPGERSRPGDYALYVGRLSPEKGVSTLVEAWQKLGTAVPLVIAGDGPLREQLQTYVAEKRLHSIRFAGRLQRDQVYEAMKKAAFLIVPSTWNEPFGLIIAEAFACGTPVLGARVGAIPEMLDDEVSGLHFAPNDPAALAQKVEWAWTHLRQMATMGRNARRIYEQRYTGGANYRSLMNIYESAIESRFGYKRSAPRALESIDRLRRTVQQPA
jgi:glycosyltransferase involved in cell wall biosynthesis